MIEWNKVRDGDMRYRQRNKDEHRFDGEGNFDTGKAPTYNLIEVQETNSRSVVLCTRTYILT